MWSLFYEIVLAILLISRKRSLVGNNCRWFRFLSKNFDKEVHEREKFTNFSRIDSLSSIRSAYLRSPAVCYSANNNLSIEKKWARGLREISRLLDRDKWSRDRLTKSCRALIAFSMHALQW